MLKAGTHFGRKPQSNWGLTQPRLDELMRGKINKFSLDALVSVATAAGFKLRFQFEEAAS
jgi:predicted XRE-type DNA-binding protein